MSDQSFDDKLMDAGVVPDVRDTPAPPEPPDVPDAPDAGLEDVAPPELILGKYKTQDDLVAAYKELERNFHEDRQRISQYEEQLQQAPQGPDPFNTYFENEEYQKWFQRAYEDPHKARRMLESALERPEQFGLDADDVINGIAAAWQQRDPWGFQNFVAERQYQQQQAVYDADRSEVQQHMIDEMANAAEARAMRELPGYEQWKMHVGQWLADNPQLVSGFAGERNVDSMYRILKFALGAVQQEARIAQWTAQQQQEPAPPSAQTRTQTRGSASKPADDDATRAFKDAIINATF